MRIQPLQAVILAAVVQMVDTQAATPVVIARAALAPMVEELNLTGTATARRVAGLSPRVDGLVAQVQVDAGDQVTQGQALVRLDDVIARVELDGAEAALNEARARLDDAIRRRDEAAGLAEQNLVAETLYEDTLAEVAILSASLNRLEADFNRQREILARHTVTAPFAGAISVKLVEQGQWVQRGTPVLELVETDVLRIDVQVPQAFFGRVELGTLAELRFDTDPTRVQIAEVKFKVPVSDPAARTFRVRLELDNKEGRLAPGMSARVTFMLSAPGAAEVIQVPRDALVRQRDGSELLWILQSDSGLQTVSSVAVRTGRIAGDQVEIVSPAVAPGTAVVIRGNENLRQGQEVAITE